MSPGSPDFHPPPMRIAMCSDYELYGRPIKRTRVFGRFIRVEFRRRPGDRSGNRALLLLSQYLRDRRPHLPPDRPAGAG